MNIRAPRPGGAVSSVMESDEWRESAVRVKH